MFAHATHPLKLVSFWKHAPGFAGPFRASATRPIRAEKCDRTDADPPFIGLNRQPYHVIKPVQAFRSIVIGSGPVASGYGFRVGAVGVRRKSRGGRALGSCSAVVCHPGAGSSPFLSDVPLFARG